MANVMVGQDDFLSGLEQCSQFVFKTGVLNASIAIPERFLNASRMNIDKSQIAYEWIVRLWTTHLKNLVSTSTEESNETVSEPHHEYKHVEWDEPLRTVDYLLIFLGRTIPWFSRLGLARWDRKKRVIQTGKVTHKHIKTINHYHMCPFDTKGTELVVQWMNWKDPYTGTEQEWKDLVAIRDFVEKSPWSVRYIGNGSDWDVAIGDELLRLIQNYKRNKAMSNE